MQIKFSWALLCPRDLHKDEWCSSSMSIKRLNAHHVNDSQWITWLWRADHSHLKILVEAFVKKCCKPNRQFLETLIIFPVKVSVETVSNLLSLCRFITKILLLFSRFFVLISKTHRESNILPSQLFILYFKYKITSVTSSWIFTLSLDLWRKLTEFLLKLGCTALQWNKWKAQKHYLSRNVRQRLLGPQQSTVSFLKFVKSINKIIFDATFRSLWWWKLNWIFGNS